MAAINLIHDLKELGYQNGIVLKDQKEIAAEAIKAITVKYHYSQEQIKLNFDTLFNETQAKIYKVYLKYQHEYGKQILKFFSDDLIRKGELKDISNFGTVLGKYFPLLDEFFLSLAQSRKSRAGRSFEAIHNALFKELGYPFDEQRVINGKPDFIMPSYNHYVRNSIDCIIFTAKRTLRERWRQIVTEGTRGLGFYLATIDEKISSNQLDEARNHRIYIVCPEEIRARYYPGKVNVLSFTQFFKDHLDPAMERWKRNNVI